MSLYRQTGGRGPAALLALLLAGLLVGAALGFLIGRGTAEQPSLAEQVEDARDRLGPVASGLGLVPIEYEGAVRGGEVTAPTEYKAARGAAARVAEGLEASGEDLREIDPDGYRRAAAAVTALRGEIEATGPPARVEALAEAAAARVESLAGTS